MGGVVIAVVLALAVVLYFVLTADPPRGTPRSARTQMWFYDTDTKQLFPGPAKERPPIAAPSGKEGLRAYVFSCGACTEDEWFVAYLEKYDDSRRSGDAPNEMAAVNESHIVRSPDSEEWYSAISEEANKVRGAPNVKCAGKGKPVECFPEM